MNKGREWLDRVYLRLHQEWLDVSRHGDPRDLVALSESLQLIECCQHNIPIPARFVKGKG